ncbi:MULTISPECIES: FGGY-family carbohydrate kinase [unclassified Paracoccus (in: a-proteobacteria)]|uniref:FGGY-family carbohydrate kinase n=1 Tax=unclassified Paracoccus (in: a-proteobacteria) TaxID=2688777 RepID=UPI0021E12CC5|nr:MULTISPECIES: FGGY-family carbohydrate kinase [unclassified Paracoccus (in: a-proteobacteria)]UXU75923.1 FGGY-family carbohydrate kinase [Paracoccus sp. SMMA_5]UXU81832.1 FGGY-family carbohydrate kinase [Paracoccus sp. SMMA_5_TC]
MSDPIFLGIDVGTGSARAGLFDAAGRMLAAARRDIRMWREGPDIAEQSSDDIWSAVCAATREALDCAGVAATDVAGIGFDATCSLVVLGPDGQPLSVSRSGDPARNIIVWMDHRAVAQAERINAQGHGVLRYVGNVISPEMETPKLLWLRENLPQSYDRAWQFMDLADYLGWRATGDLARSSCTVTCKWTYLAHEDRWDPDYFRSIGLGDLADQGFARIGQRIVAPGTALGAGLSAGAAADLGLQAGIPVGAGLIDAHAGGIGTVGMAGSAERNMAYVFGTSSCTMTTTRDPVFVPGVWGPYFQAMVPGMWLNEGGQSAAGAAIEQLLAFHPAAAEAAAAARAAGQSLPAWLAARAAAAVPRLSDTVALADGLHVVPEFLGNRAPFADPHARAIVAGLGMQRDADSLVALYVAGLCGIAYGLRQIIEAQDRAGASIARIVISGGAGQMDLVRQLLADGTGKPVLASSADEPVLLGAAILGAVAAGHFADMGAAMAGMSHPGATYAPDAAAGRIHDHRFGIFAALQAALRQDRQAVAAAA